MATLIPAYSSCAQRMTPGERRVAQRLEDKLDDSYLLWYNVPIGSRRLKPDFIILSPYRGIIILEVKDWKLDTIHSISHDSVELITDRGLQSAKHPLLQARNYLLEVCNLLERDPLLVQHDGRYQGKLAFPYSYGAVLANIKRSQVEEQPDFWRIFDPALTLFQDDIYDRVDPLEFQEKLWNLCTYQFGEPLDPQQIDRVRWHLFPDVRINPQQLSLFDACDAESEPLLQVPDILRIMDIQQEQLARSLGDGHRVIHGVAGSGKTLILGYRCEHLAQVMTKPILVLCFNVALAAKLRHFLLQKNLHQKVVVRHFHGWCSDILRDHKLSKPGWNQYQGDDYGREMVQRVIDGVNRGVIPGGLYGAILIDEGHDFQADWFRLIVQMVDPTTDSVLVLYDDAQNIYEQKHQRFSFKSVGIQAQGRTTILRLNYRNTQEVLSLAYAFAKEWLSETDVQADADEPILISPQSVGRHGPAPLLVPLPSFKAELVFLVKEVRRLQQEGLAWNDIAILYRDQWMGTKVYEALSTAQIPVEWINQSRQSRNYQPQQDSIKLLTMHSSKGLEFPAVLIPGLGFLPNRHHAPSEEARLLYVAMTRSIQHLILSYDRVSLFAQRIQHITRHDQQYLQ
jgi:hypothetical protein